MLFLSLFKWWYGRGWGLIIGDIQRRLKYINQLFSVDIILRTLFSPWRKIISYPGSGIAENMRSMIDNLLSRIIGFCVRFFALLAALLSLVVTVVLGFIELIIWPLLPVSVIFLVVKSI